MATADAMAHHALRGVGDAVLGEWREWPRGVYHLRRRLSVAECEAFGLWMRDVRGTDEGRERAVKLVRVVPQLKAMATQEIVSP